MPFSASTCITELGTTSLGPVLSAYTDFDSYLNPFSFVNTNQITGAACPYVFTGIPDGATNIRLIDPTNSCCITIPIQSDNFCDTCDLGFTVLSSQTNSQIIAGDLTGSCQANISNYVINWYGPNSSTNIAFRSGKGNTFSYQFTHPLTGSGFVFAQAGTYTPVIDRVIISGITFSHTGGTGTYDATLDCFDAIQVNPLTCDNGNTPTSAYTHSYYFSGTGQSAIPLNVTFQLSANTNYFAYSFTGQAVPDKLRIIYSGSNTTPNQLVLEDVSVGSQVSSNNYTWVGTKLFSNSRFSKVLCLTGITRSVGDNLTIQITPNAGNTEWALGLRCLTNFNCDTCIIQKTATNDLPFKIIKSSITVVTASCYSNIGYKLSGCPFSSSSDNDIYRYWPGGESSTGGINWFFQNTYSIDNELGIMPRSATNFTSLNYYNATVNLSWNSNSCTSASYSLQSSPTYFQCFNNAPNPGTINYSKYLSGTCPTCVGVIDLTFTNPTQSNNLYWLQHYYNSYLSAMNSLSTWGISACTATTSFYPGVNPISPVNGPFSGGTSANNIPSYSDPQDLRYYRAMYFCVPSATGSSACFSNTADAGGLGFVGNSGSGLAQCYFIHPSAIVTTGQTGSSYGMRIVMSTILNQKVFSSCEAVTCDGPRNGTVNAVNNSSTGSTSFISNISFTSTIPASFVSPFTTYSPLFYNGTQNITGNITNGFTANCTTTKRTTNSLTYNWYDLQNYTFPKNPTTSAVTLQYSAVTCPNLRRWSNNNINTTSANLVSTQSTSLSYAGYYTELLNIGETGPIIPPATEPTLFYRSFEIYAMPINNGVFVGNTTPGTNSIGTVDTTGPTAGTTNPNWVLAYRQVAGVQQVCNSQYVVGC